MNIDYIGHIGLIGMKMIGYPPYTSDSSPKLPTNQAF